MISMMYLLLRFAKIFFLTLILIFLSSSALPQTVTGSITGQIGDSAGTLLAGANITVVSPKLQGIRGSSTLTNGIFHITHLPAGIYKVRVSSVGYASVIYENVEVQMGKTTNLEKIILKFTPIDLTEVNIAAVKPFIDPESTTYGGNINSTYFEQLPVNRNYKDITTLMPQANLSYYGDQVNLGGATGFENKYFVDGVEVTDPLIGADGTNLPYNFVEQIELKTGGYGAESRSALGGLLNVITHSGSNKFHGSVFGFYTSNRMMENRRFGVFDSDQGDFSNYDIGFGIGGPISADKLWFYAAYNPTFHRRDVDVPGYGVHIDKTLMHSFAAKLNWKASDKLNLTFTATGDPAKRNAVGRNVSAAFVYNPDPYLQNIVEGGINFSLNGTYLINNNFSIEALAARVNRHDTGEPATEKGKELLYFDISDLSASGGVGAVWDSYRHSTVGKISGTLILGTHLLNAGVEYKTNSVNNQYDVHNIIKRSSDLYIENRYQGSGIVYNQVPSAFIQDTWNIYKGISINGGLRWDRQYITGTDGEIAQTITTPVQPRIGFVIIPFNNISNRIFGSFGLFSQEFALFPSVDYHSDKGKFQSIYYDHDPRVDNTGGYAYEYFQSISPEVEGLRGQYFEEFNLGFEIMFWRNTRAVIQGVYRTLCEAIDDAYLISQDRRVFGNPGRGILSEWPRPKRDYKALIITLERRLDEKFNFIASYVLSQNYGNYEGLYNAVQHDPFPNTSLIFNHLNTSRHNTTGLLPNDRTHVFKFSGYYNFPFSLAAGLSFVVQSGTPLNEFAFTDLGLIFLSPRGTAGKTPALWNLSGRLTYTLPYISTWNTKLILDVFHIASQRKPVDIVQVKYDGVDAEGHPLENPFYRQVYRYQPSMSLRLGLEINF
jgi:hypothetical protein